FWCVFRSATRPWRARRCKLVWAQDWSPRRRERETEMRAFILLLAAASAASAQSDAPIYDRTLASFTSERLPSWLKLSGEFRTRVEGRTGFNYQPDNNDAYGLFRNRLNVELLPTGWLDFYFQGQDSRAPGLDAGRPLTTFKDPFDLRQAYVRLGKADGLVRVTVGRQLL